MNTTQTIVAERTTLETRSIEPLHGVMDQSKLEALIVSMDRDGWVGDDLLVVAIDECPHQAITGSHRYAAAAALGIEVPVTVLSSIDDDVSNDDLSAELKYSDDFDRLEILTRSGCQRAIDLMTAEVDNNG